MDYMHNGMYEEFSIKTSKAEIEKEIINIVEHSGDGYAIRFLKSDHVIPTTTK